MTSAAISQFVGSQVAAQARGKLRVMFSDIRRWHAEKDSVLLEHLEWKLGDPAVKFYRKKPHKAAHA